ncbi:VCBS domain-containing protein [Natronorubrum thiooxidans]|uniref:VCBS repeat-containing protein n=1 Tax=Natronorubrum thiooxidans TaxID=308853 RepID=A0A1N7FCP5_9EURY|nr:VCBS domain-containing protein [Natronorubrum thiooxidans]SIR98093.1 VCBS repeat-containing protein [Natronorubrum thiooxidans]
MESTIMSMNRRNVLVGLGTIVAGGGAALGTGAFSSVEANRSVNVSTTGDAGALIGLSIEAGSALEGTGGTDDEIIAFDLENDINLDAVTTFDDVFTVTNTGGTASEITLEIEDASDNTSLLTSDVGSESDAGMYLENSSVSGGQITLGSAQSDDLVFSVVFDMSDETDTTSADGTIPDNIIIRATQQS